MGQCCYCLLPTSLFQAQVGLPIQALTIPPPKFWCTHCDVIDMLFSRGIKVKKAYPYYLSLYSWCLLVIEDRSYRSQRSTGSHYICHHWIRVVWPSKPSFPFSPEKQNKTKFLYYNGDSNTGHLFNGTMWIPDLIIAGSLHHRLPGNIQFMDHYSDQHFVNRPSTKWWSE